jgi:hypothetical protein
VIGIFCPLNSNFTGGLYILLTKRVCIFNFKSKLYFGVTTLLISLQAPVSDREYRATLPETAEMIDLASKMISEGRGMDLMPREANPDAPITAYRYNCYG